MAARTDKYSANAGMPMPVVWRRIEQLESDPRACRWHTPKQIQRLAKRIAAFGFNIPILIDRAHRIIAGHSWLLGARKLGWSSVPTILLDHLTEAQARAFVMADNRMTEAASWDDLLLVMELKELAAAGSDG